MWLIILCLDRQSKKNSDPSYVFWNGRLVESNRSLLGVVNKFNYNIDSRNKKTLFGCKNFFKCKTKNFLFPNESSLKINFLGAINHIKNNSKNKEFKK